LSSFERNVTDMGTNIYIFDNGRQRKKSSAEPIKTCQNLSRTSKNGSV